MAVYHENTLPKKNQRLYADSINIILLLLLLLSI